MVGGHFTQGIDMQKLATIELPDDTTNAFEILALCQTAAEQANAEKSKIQDFLEDAVTGDFEHLLRSVMTHFEVAEAGR
jgi:hypothetical protein